MNCIHDILQHIEFFKNKYNISDRSIEIVKDYYGIRKEKDNTLEQIGDKYELSKERIRQIIEDVLSVSRKYFYNNKDFIQYINKINAISHKYGLMREDKFKLKLFEKSILLSEKESIQWILKQKELFSTRSTINIEKVNKTNFIIPNKYALGDKIPPYAEKKMIEKGHINKNGKIVLNKINRSDLSSYLERGSVVNSRPAKKLKTFLIKENVKNGFISKEKFLKKNWKILEKEANLHFFDNNIKLSFIEDVSSSYEDFIALDKDWFYFSSTGRNVFERNAYKTIAALQNIEIKKLKERIMVSTTIEQLPSDDVLFEYFNYNKNIDPYIKDNKFFVKNKKLVLDDCLKNIELIMFNILKRNGPLGHKEFAELCSEKDISNYQFCMKLNNSPLFRKLKRGVYSI